MERAIVFGIEKFATHDGPELAGPALSLLMVISGRTVALEDLHGPGVELLA